MWNTMEQQALQELKHNNIIMLKRIIMSLGHVFIEMEKLNGGTLEDFIEKKKNTTSEGTDEKASDSSPSV